MYQWSHCNRQPGWYLFLVLTCVFFRTRCSLRSGVADLPPSPFRTPLPPWGVCWSVARFGVPWAGRLAIAASWGLLCAPLPWPAGRGRVICAAASERPVHGAHSPCAWAHPQRRWPCHEPGLARAPTLLAGLWIFALALRCICLLSTIFVITNFFGKYLSANLLPGLHQRAESRPDDHSAGCSERPWVLSRGVAPKTPRAKPHH